MCPAGRKMVALSSALPVALFWISLAAVPGVRADGKLLTAGQTLSQVTLQ